MLSIARKILRKPLLEVVPFWRIKPSGVVIISTLMIAVSTPQFFQHMVLVSVFSGSTCSSGHSSALSFLQMLSTSHCWACPTLFIGVAALIQQALAAGMKLISKQTQFNRQASV